MNDDTILNELRSMRGEVRSAHDSLTQKVDGGFEKITTQFALHEREDIASFAELGKRLTPLEQTDQLLKWAIRGSLSLVGVGVIDVVKNHFPKWFK